MTRLSLAVTFTFCVLLSGSCDRQKTKSSDNIFISDVVEKNGLLRVSGNRIVNQHGDTVALHGMSLFWSQWMGKYYNESCIDWLVKDWNSEVVRAALGVEQNGYLKKAEREEKKISTVVDAAIDRGIYVIIDWHSHHAEKETEKAVEYFSRMSSQYGDYPNVIYEIYNEPLKVSWDSVLKPYAEQVVSAIRANDPDNIIIMGTPNWSQDVDIAARNPVDDSNIAYAVHFYASTHKQWLRDKCDSALAGGVALWASEFGTCFANGDGDINYEEMETWFTYMENNGISWCNWSIADKQETASALKPGAGRHGGWTDEDLTESGRYIREKLRK